MLYSATAVLEEDFEISEEGPSWSVGQRWVRIKQEAAEKSLSLTFYCCFQSQKDEQGAAGWSPRLQWAGNTSDWQDWKNMNYPNSLTRTHPVYFPIYVAAGEKQINRPINNIIVGIIQILLY